LRGVRGSTDRAIVLAFRYDCRNWQAARGRGDHGLTARHHRLDLAPPCESSREERKSVGSRPAAAKLWVRWRAPYRESGEGSTCRWKAPRIGEAARVDARAVEAVLVLRDRSAMGDRGARQGASEAGSPALGAADNAPPGKLCLRAELFSSFINLRRDERWFVRSWRGAVKRGSTRGRIAERWSDAAFRMARG
jgi:hypothetical protein